MKIFKLILFILFFALTLANPHSKIFEMSGAEPYNTALAYNLTLYSSIAYAKEQEIVDWTCE